MSEGARASSIPMTCPYGHVIPWAYQAEAAGVPYAHGCSSPRCGMPLRRLRDDEEAAYRLDGPAAVTLVVQARYRVEIAAYRMGGIEAVRDIVGKLSWPWDALP